MPRNRNSRYGSSNNLSAPGEMSATFIKSLERKYMAKKSYLERAFPAIFQDEETKRLRDNPFLKDYPDSVKQYFKIDGGVKLFRVKSTDKKVIDDIVSQVRSEVSFKIGDFVLRHKGWETNVKKGWETNVKTFVRNIPAILAREGMMTDIYPEFFSVCESKTAPLFHWEHMQMSDYRHTTVDDIFIGDKFIYEDGSYTISKILPNKIFQLKSNDENSEHFIVADYKHLLELRYIGFDKNYNKSDEKVFSEESFLPIEQSEGHSGVEFARNIEDSEERWNPELREARRQRDASPFTYQAIPMSNLSLEQAERIISAGQLIQAPVRRRRSVELRNTTNVTTTTR